MLDTKDLFNLDACLTLARYAESIGVTTEEVTGFVTFPEDTTPTWEISISRIGEAKELPNKCLP